MAELLRYPTLEERGFPRNNVAAQYPIDAIIRTVEDTTRYEEFCPEWNGMVPKTAGTIIPLSQLPLDHPAVTYMHSRNFTDFPALEQQLGFGFCAALRADYPSHYVADHGFPSTPLGRIVVQSRQRGVIFNWQARLMEMDAINGKYLSVDAANLLRPNFERLIYVADTDAPGQAAVAKVKSILQMHAPRIRLSLGVLPSTVKDAAELTPEAAEVFKKEVVSHF
jgi:hypothetical protein